MKNILLICSAAPEAHISSEDYLDTALTLAAMSLNVSLLFTGDGTQQLSKQANKTIKDKQSMLPMYGLSNIYVEEQSAANTNRNNCSNENVEYITTDQLFSLFNRFDHIIHT